MSIKLFEHYDMERCMLPHLLPILFIILHKNISVRVVTMQWLCSETAFFDKYSFPTLMHVYIFLCSGIDFEGHVVGMAGIGTICGLSSTGVNMVSNTLLYDIFMH